MTAPAGRGRAARIWRITAAVVAGLLIAAALAIGALRLAIARVPENAARIQAWVERQTDLRVEYASLDARLRWYGPEIVLRDVRVLARDGSEAILRTREGSVGLDLWSLFRSGELVAGRVRFSGPTATIVRLPDGRIRLLGQNERPLDRPPFDLDRLPAGRVDVEDATVTYQDLASGAAPVTLHALRLTLRRERNRTAVGGYARLPDALGRSVSFSGDVEGSLEHFESLNAELQLQVEGIVLAGFASFLPARVARPLDGNGRVEAGIRFVDGRMTGSRLDLELEDVALALPPRDTPVVPTLRLSEPKRPGGAPPLSMPLVTSTIEQRRADTGPGEVRYSQLRGSIRLRREGEQWTLRAQRLLLTGAGQASAEPADFSMHWRGNAVTTYSASLSASRLDLADAWPLARAFAPASFDRWAGLNPRGTVRSLRVDVSRERAGAWPGFTLSADVANLGFAASGDLPGLTGLTGVASGTDQGGRLALRSRELSFDLPRVFRQPIGGAAVTADVDWHRDGGAWVVSSPAVNVMHPEARAHGSFEYRFDRPGVSPILTMDIQVDAAEVALAGRVLPYGSFGPGAVSWLVPAFVAGHVDTGHVTYRGPIHAFPFRRGEGDFTATASVSGVAVHYFDGFAPLHEGRGVVEFHNAGFVARLHGGEVGGLSLDRAEVGIVDMHETVVEVDAAASGDMVRALPFVQSSPVGAELGQQFMGLTGHGPADFTVKLHLPTSGTEKHDLLVRANLHGATVGIPALRAPAERVDGTFEIHNLEMRARALRGTMLGGPFELDVEPGSATSDIDASVLLHGRGRSAGAGLPAFIGLPNGIRMSGAADWKLEGRIERRSDSQQWSSRYDIASDLVGLGVSAPEPFPKRAEESRPTHVGLGFPQSGGLDLAVESGPARVRLLLAEGKDGRLRLDRGIARMDGRPPVLPDHAGLRFAGDWPAFDLGEWLALGSGGGSVQSLADWLGPTDVHLEKARIFGFEFAQLDATLKPQRTELKVGVKGPAAEGAVDIPADLDGGAPIRFAMARLHLQAVNSPGGSGEDELDPRKMPALDVDIADFAWEERNFGHLVAKVTKQEQGLRLEDLTATSPDCVITASGQWVLQGKGSQTKLALQLTSTDVAATSKALGIPGGTEAERGHATADLTWPGGLTGEIVEHLNGTLRLALDRGQVRSLKPGAGRVLGLTSLAELPRRLSLDFHDVTDTGLAFDTVRGDWEIRDGNAYTQNVVLKGPAIDIGLVGRTGLAAKDYDQTVVVSGNPAGPVTVAGALVAGPVGAAGGFLLSQLFKGQLKGAARIYYHVTGPWANPVVERVSAEAGEAAKAPAQAQEQDSKP